MALSFCFHGKFLFWSSLAMRGLPLALAAIAVVLFLIAGAGLLALEPWGRIMSLILGVAYISDPIAELWSGARSFTPLGAIFYYADNVAALSVSAWAIWYLSRPGLRSVFERNWTRFQI
jgi:hypothetical protein